MKSETNSVLAQSRVVNYCRVADRTTNTARPLMQISPNCKAVVAIYHDDNKRQEKYPLSLPNNEVYKTAALFGHSYYIICSIWTSPHHFAIMMRPLVFCNESP